MIKIAYVFGNGDEAILVLNNDEVYTIGIVCVVKICYLCVKFLCYGNANVFFIRLRFLNFWWPSP